MNKFRNGYNVDFDYMVLDAYNRIRMLGYDVTLISLYEALESHVASNTKLLNKYTK